MNGVGGPHGKDVRSLGGRAGELISPLPPLASFPITILPKNHNARRTNTPGDGLNLSPVVCYIPKHSKMKYFHVIFSFDITIV